MTLMVLFGKSSVLFLPSGRCKGRKSVHLFSFLLLQNLSMVLYMMRLEILSKNLPQAQSNDCQSSEASSVFRSRKRQRLET